MSNFAVAPKPLLMVAETYLEHCATTFDLIVNDMILEGQESARLMVEYAAQPARA